MPITNISKGWHYGFVFNSIELGIAVRILGR